MKKINRNTFIDQYLERIKDTRGIRWIYINPEWLDGHILIDSRMQVTIHDFETIKTYLDGLKVVYKVLTGHDRCYQSITRELPMIDREYYGIYIYNSNFKNADDLAVDF